MRDEIAGWGRTTVAIGETRAGFTVGLLLIGGGRYGAGSKLPVSPVGTAGQAQGPGRLASISTPRGHPNCLQ